MQWSCLTETIQASVLPFTLQGNIKKRSVSKFICFCEMLPLNVLNYGKFCVAKSLLEKVYCTHPDVGPCSSAVAVAFSRQTLLQSWCLGTLCWGNCVSLNWHELCFFLLSPGFGVQYWGAVKYQELHLPSSRITAPQHSALMFLSEEIAFGE